MLKKSITNLYRVTFWLVGISFAVILVTALIIQFVIFPNINRYKDDIARYITQSIHQKVVIGEINVDWKNFDPRLTLSNITLFDAQDRPALVLNNTNLLVSWLSIPKFEPHLAELRLQNPELTLRRTKTGEIFVAGISLEGASKPELPNWLLRQSKVKLKNARIIWIDELRNAPPLSLEALDLELLSPPWKSLLKQHRLSVTARPSIGTKKPITLFSKFYGSDVSQFNNWHGELNMHLKDAQVPDFKAWIDFPIQINEGAGNAQIALTFADAMIHTVTADLDMKALHFQVNNQLAPMSFNKLLGKIVWNNNEKEQSLILTNFNLSNHDLQLNNINAIYSVTKIDGLKTDNNKMHDKKNFSLQIPILNLKDLHYLLNGLSLPPEQLERFNTLKPAGLLQDLSLKWQGLNNQTVAYQLNGKFKNLSIVATDKMPGFTQINGEIKANQQAGLVKLNAKNASLEFKDILRLPIPVDVLYGSFNWVIKNNKKIININNLSIKNTHIAGAINGEYAIDEKEGDEIHLNGHFDRANLKYANFYYPTILGKDTLHWLDTSILSGNADNIQMTLKGKLKDFPFVDSKNNLDLKKGLFRISADIHDGVIEFGEEWPLIEDVDLHMIFEGDRMELNANKGHLLGNQIIHSQIIIPQLDANEPILTIQGELKGAVSEGILFVNKSPVVQLTQGFTDDLKSTGQGQLKLNLKIPLNDVEQSQYQGAYQFTNASITSESVPMLSQMNGVLEFTENSLSANNVKANFSGAPLNLNIVTGKDSVIRVNAKGKISDALLNQYFAGINHYLSGNTDFSADIQIQKPQVITTFRSDLIGMTSYLPAPLNKSTNDRLTLKIDKKEDPNSQITLINVGNLIAAKVNQSFVAGNKFTDRVNVILNQVATPIDIKPLSDAGLSNAAKGLYMSGNLEYVDADAWKLVMKDLLANNKDNTNLSFQKIALKINTLDLFNRRFNQIKISNKSSKSDIQATIESRELSGDLQWQAQNNGKLIAKLSHFMIPEASPIRASQNPLLKSLVIDNKENTKLNEIYPAINITAEKFEFNKKNMGNLELIADPQGSNWNIEKFKLNNPDSTLTANGAWTDINRNPNTSLNIIWNIEDLGKTLQRFGYADTVKSGEGELNGQLTWAGSPHEFDVLALNGTLKFDVRKGQILKVQPGVGRLLGLLSLQSLPRRLSLDFRDLFSNGFAFDKINANVSVDRGVMRSDNFKMTGPAADVNIKGETNLKNETQKLTVNVFPHVSDSLSLAALAGGPLVGAVAFLAQKVLKDPLNKIVSSQYDIIGTWDNPQEVKSEENTGNNPLNFLQ